MPEPMGPEATEMANKRGVHKASEITDLQIKAAKQLHSAHFSETGSDTLLAAIIQALASNYAVIRNNP